MGRFRRLRPTPSMMVAFAALFVAGAGSATAARLITGSQIKNSSITSADIRNSSITSADIRNSSITSTDVRNGSLLRRDFKSGQLPRGAQGLPGTAGRAGRDGFGVLSYQAGFIELEATNGSDTDEGAAFVECPAGTYPTGGDAYAVNAAEDIDETVAIAEFFFTDIGGRPNSWAAEATNHTAGSIDLFIEVICANAAQAPPPVGKTKAKAPGIREARPVR